MALYKIIYNTSRTKLPQCRADEVLSEKLYLYKLLY